MPADPAATEHVPAPPRRRLSTTLSRAFVGAVLAYLLIAYVVAPAIWRRFEKRHPALSDAPTLTHTAAGIPGDPLNIALVGTEEGVHRAMLTAKWYPADPLTLASSLRIAADVVIERPYEHAPVSNLYLWDRKEDLAFEQSVGADPRRRHHVRFWRSATLDAEGRPCWFGSATLDDHVGLSYRTGQITHHISPDVDAERDKIVDDIRASGHLLAVQWIDRFQPELQGKNGGGDPWRTDGRLAVVEVADKERP